MTVGSQNEVFLTEDRTDRVRELGEPPGETNPGEKMGDGGQDIGSRESEVGDWNAHQRARDYNAGVKGMRGFARQQLAHRILATEPRGQAFGGKLATGIVGEASKERAVG
jgi:hypothetical protein